MEQIEGFMVFWMYQSHSTERMRPIARHFELNEMNQALAFMEKLRSDSLVQFVNMASQTANLVGKFGAAGVKDGKLPNGEDYTYGKGDALSQRTKVYAKVVDEPDDWVEP